jgi:branched-chain amino acid transport system ATP-binding protein
MSTPVSTLKLDGITAGYGGTTVLWDVNLEVLDSSVVALLGPNGAGKTTLLRAACGFIPTKEGSIRLDGQDVTGQTMHQIARRGVCHVPEGRGIFPSLTVRENLMLFSPKGREAEELERATASFPILGQRLRQTTGSMSGGEQQMLAMVRAYLSDPRLVLVDEASMGLAPLIVDQIFDFLQGIARQGTSLLIVEQYVYRALALADYVYRLNHGTIVFAGTPEEVQQQDIFERYLGAEVSVTG